MLSLHESQRGRRERTVAATGERGRGGALEERDREVGPMIAIAIEREESVCARAEETAQRMERTWRERLPGNEIRGVMTFAESNVPELANSSAHLPRIAARAGHLMPGQRAVPEETATPWPTPETAATVFSKRATNGPTEETKLLATHSAR